MRQTAVPAHACRQRPRHADTYTVGMLYHPTRWIEPATATATAAEPASDSSGPADAASCDASAPTTETAPTTADTKRTIRALSGRINVPMTVRLLVGGVLVALVVTLLAWGAMRATAAVSAAVKRRMPAKTPARS